MQTSSSQQAATSRQLRPIPAILAVTSLVLLFIFSTVAIDGRQAPSVPLYVSDTKKAPAIAKPSMSSADNADSLRRDVGLALQNDTESAAEAYLAGERARRSARKRRSAEASLSLSRSHSLPVHEGSAAPNMTLKIDLVIYVFFQRELNGRMYNGINWKWLPKLDSAVEEVQPTPPLDTTSPQTNTDAIVGDNTEQIVRHLRGEHQERDRTRMAFVAVNPHVKKSFRLFPHQLSSSVRKKIAGKQGRNGLWSVKGSYLTKTIFGGRLLKEWRMPGYSRGLGFEGGDPHNWDADEAMADSNATPLKSRVPIERQNEVIHLLEEFGTLRTLYRSGLTFLHSNVGVDGEDSGTHRALAADADGDGVQEWMGVFPNDVRIDLRLVQLIRRRIRQGTSKFLGRNVSFDSAPSTASPAQPKKKQRNAGAYFKGRVVGGAVINSDSVNNRRTLPPLPDAYSPDIALPANHHCCIFYSGSYPSIYLFNNALGQQLLVLYNSFFNKAVTFEHIIRPTAPDAILESFVLPNALFNKLFPFVDHVIHMLVVDGKKFHSPDVPPASSRDSEVNATDADKGALVASPTEVLERALALALVLEPMWLRIRLPVRHARDF